MEVVCALIIKNGRVLLGRRPLEKNHGGLWEFPGGKIKLGESPKQALLRELNEELGIQAAESQLQELGAVAAGAIHLQLFFLFSAPPYCPKEHSAVAWLSFIDLSKHSLCPSDQKAIQLYGKVIKEAFAKSTSCYGELKDL